MSARRDEMQNSHINARRDETEPQKFMNFHDYNTTHSSQWFLNYKILKRALTLIKFYLISNFNYRKWIQVYICSLGFEFLKFKMIFDQSSNKWSNCEILLLWLE